MYARRIMNASIFARFAFKVIFALAPDFFPVDQGMADVEKILRANIYR